MSETFELKRVAHLARLGVSDEELQQLDKKIHSTMALIDRMQATDTTDVPPMAHPLSVDQPMREDQAQDVPWQALQNCAPKNSTEHNLYLVPQVIE